MPIGRQNLAFPLFGGASGTEQESRNHAYHQPVRQGDGTRRFYRLRRTVSDDRSRHVATALLSAVAERLLVLLMGRFPC